MNAEEPEPKTPKRLLSIFYGLLLYIGISLYTVMGILYNTWTDIGVYALCVILIGFGIFGLLLYSK